MKLQNALEMVSQTDAGVVRSHNEDSVAQDPAYGLAVLADGMGGYNAGEVASGIAISVITTEISQKLDEYSPVTKEGRTGLELGRVLVDKYIRKANAAIYHAAQNQPQYAGMGTTVACTLFYDNRVIVGHVGDSRVYRLRDGQLEAITRDHSLLQEQLDSGMISAEDAKLSKNKNLVTRALGVDIEVEPELNEYPVQSGDLFLLCSDGLNDMVEDEEIQNTMYAMQSNLPLAVEQLIQMANDNGGRDNVSVVLVRVKGDFSMSRNWFRRIWSWFARMRG